MEGAPPFLASSAGVQGAGGLREGKDVHGHDGPG